jgi:hypothetical protein
MVVEVVAVALQCPLAPLADGNHRLEALQPARGDGRERQPRTGGHHPCLRGDHKARPRATCIIEAAVNSP